MKGLPVTRYFVLVYFLVCCTTARAQDWAQATALISEDIGLAISYADSLFTQVPDKEQWHLEKSTAFGRALANTRNYDQAIDWFSFMDSLAGNSLKKYDTVYATFTMNFGRAYAMNALYKQAITWYERSLLHVEKYELESPPLFYLTRSLGYLYFNLNQYYKAIEYHKKSLDYALNANTSNIDVVDAYNNIGLIYPHMNEPEVAMKYYRQAINLLIQEAPNHPKLASIYNNAGLVRMDQKRFDEALELLNQALAFHEKKGTASKAWASTLNNKGLVLNNIDKSEEAKVTLYRSIDLKKQLYGNNHTQLSTSYINLGKAYLNLNEPDSANACFLRSLEINADKFSNRGPEVARDRFNLARLQLYLDDLNSAEKQIDLGLRAIFGKEVKNVPKVAEIASLHVSYIQLISEKAKLIRSFYENDLTIDLLKQSYAWYNLSFQMISQQQEQFIEQESKIFLSENFGEIIGNYIATCFDLYDLTAEAEYLESAFNVIENEKSFVLLSSLNKAENQRWLNVPDSVIAIKESINRRLNTYKTILYDGRLAQDSAQIKMANDSIFALTLEKEEIIKKVSENAPMYAGFSQKQGVSLAEAQKELVKGNMKILTYLESPEFLFGIGVGKTGLSKVKIPITELTALVLALNNAVEETELKNFVAASYALYETILSPLVADRPEQLVIFPSIRLSAVPFEMLATGKRAMSFDKIPYVLNDYLVSYHYSAGIMKLLQPESVEKLERFTGFAPGFKDQSSTLLTTRSAVDSMVSNELSALPFAKAEVSFLANLWRGQEITGEAATESSFKHEIRQNDIIHVASHVLINPEDPLLSRIVFSQEKENNQEDGLLHIYELLAMDLNADLITLSACNSGIGKGYAGEGVMSLGKGFMYSGVPNVTMSLWSVPDRSTSELMKLFYNYLNEGHGKAKSLRLAKLKYLESADNNTAAPYYWAGFIFLGNLEPTDQTILWPFLSGLVLAILLLILLYKRKKNAFRRSNIKRL